MLNILISIVALPKFSKISLRLFLHVHKRSLISFCLDLIQSNLHAIIVIGSRILVQLIHAHEILLSVRLFVHFRYICIYSFALGIERNIVVFLRFSIQFNLSIATFVYQVCLSEACRFERGNALRSADFGQIR